MMEEYIQSLLENALTCPVKWGYFEDGETLPRITMGLAGGRQFQTLDSTGPVSAAIRIDCWGETVPQAVQASREVKSVLAQHRGGPVLNTRLTNGIDRFNQDPQVAKRRILTFAITYRE